MGSSILSEVDNTLDLRMGLSNPPALSCQLASALSVLAPAQRAGAQRLCALARLRHADCIGQCPLSGVTRKTFAHTSSSQFDPTATSARSIRPPRRVQKSPGRCRGLKFAGDRKLDHYLPMAGPPQLGPPQLKW